LEENIVHTDETKKVGKKVSDPKSHYPTQEGEDLKILQSTHEKPKKKKEKNPEEKGEAKPRKKKEKKKTASDEHNTNSNSTAPTLHDDGHEVKENPAKKEEKPAKVQEFIQIDDEPNPSEDRNKQQRDRNLNPPIPQQNPIMPFMQLYNTMLQNELPFNKILADMMNNPTPQIPPHLLDYFKSNMK